MTPRYVLWALTGLALLPASGPAVSQASQLPILPLEHAVTIAHEAVRECARRGWAVTAVVVDPSGLVRVQLRGDRATPHTDVTAFRKAYTVVSLGPIFDFDRSSAFVGLVQSYPGGAGAALTTIPNVIALGGAVAIERDGVMIGAIGVGGAPGGDRDEACAAVGVQAAYPADP